jgi:hypothetical protein
VYAGVNSKEHKVPSDRRKDSIMVDFENDEQFIMTDEFDAETLALLAEVEQGL